MAVLGEPFWQLLSFEFMRAENGFIFRTVEPYSGNHKTKIAANPNELHAVIMDWAENTAREVKKWALTNEKPEGI
ncbi:MAG TPA: hypothetical protein VJQ82_08725 [Terriglobales bacterium]|nr:hypothetical protein [Terriglobales bacterium]